MILGGSFSFSFVYLKMNAAQPPRKPGYNSCSSCHQKQCLSAGSDLGFPSISLPIEQPWRFDRNEDGLPRKEAEVRALRNTIIAPRNQIVPGVDAIVPPRHMIQVTINLRGHTINGRGLVEAAKVSCNFL